MAVKDCCKKAENLVLKEQKNDLIIYVCKVCNCKHYNLTVDAGKFLGEVKPL